MSHPHEEDFTAHQLDKIYKDEENNATIGSHQLPVPMNWKVLVQPNETKKETKGGIILPSISRDNESYLTAHGTIAALGELAYHDRDTGQPWKMSTRPQVGNRITYGKYAGQKIVVNGVSFLILNDDEITSILPEGAEITGYLPT